MAYRGADRRLGKAAERRHLPFQRPAAGQLGDGRQQRHAALGDAQAAQQRRPIFAAILVFFGACGNLLERPVGAFLDEAGQEIPFGDREPAQKRAVAEQRGQEAACLRGWRSRRGRARRGLCLLPRRAPTPRRQGPARGGADRPGAAARQLIGGDVG